MSSNQLRLLLLSVMAVFAISAAASASASAATICYMVAEPGTGTFENSACTVADKTNEYIKAERAVEISPGIGCAKVITPKTGNYKDSKCTEKTTGGEFVKVKISKDIWEVCQEGGTEKYTEHKCSAKSETGKWSWLPIEAGKSFEVTSSGGVFTLEASGLKVTCETVKDEGLIEAGGKDKATKITFEKCKTGTVGCEVKNKGGTLKTVVVSEIPTKLEQVVIGEKEVLVDKFEQKPGPPKEFVTLEFEGAPCAGAGYVTTKVKGDVAAEVKNEANGEVKLTFPKPAIAQTPELEAFSEPATLVGSVTEKLVNGWAFRGV